MIDKLFCLLLLSCSAGLMAQPASGFKINDQEYFERPGVNVMMFHDYYPMGYQGGITIIQNGSRVASNGDVRLWPNDRPFPESGKREVNRAKNEISVAVFYNDSLRSLYTDTRYPYPDLNITSRVTVKGEQNSFRITVDLEKPLPAAWANKLGFSIQFFPNQYFNRPYYMDAKPGFFPRQLNGPVSKRIDGLIDVLPLATGKKIVILPDAKEEMITIESLGEPLELIDGRVARKNGWFTLRSPLKTGLTHKTMEWLVTVASKPNFKSPPVIHISQVGYHPNQPKTAILELDKNNLQLRKLSIVKINDHGGQEPVKSGLPTLWGNFLRYQYARFDFSEVKAQGLYKISYGNIESNLFRIDSNIFDRHVWQPTLEYFLPVQMCHMRINDQVKVWHGLCHDDDALMAPISHIHFDGYSQGPSTLTTYKSGDQVQGINVGGWHDAGDYDLRVESQANTVRALSFAWELFKPMEDETTVSQKQKLVEMHVPDGIPDILQQIEHGVLSIVGGYQSMGRLYRGIIESTGKQYSLLGDAATMTDQLFYNPNLKVGEKTATESGTFDDRWVFTENNPRREIDVAACLATAYRSLRGYNDPLATNTLKVALDLWQKHAASSETGLIDLAVELYKSTSDPTYLQYITDHKVAALQRIDITGPALARLYDQEKNIAFATELRAALAEYKKTIDLTMRETPFGVRYKPNIWGDGWNIQKFGMNQYFLYRSFPDIFSPAPVFNVLNFVLGVHPGENTASFVSGVGVHSLLVAYGINRDDWSFIPGGSASGTALIRPDLPELKEWPYLWQQTEYVLGGGATNYMFVVLACNDLLRHMK